MIAELTEITPLLNNCMDKGDYYLALCPFHNEKNPSFVMYKNTGAYICFSCNERGNYKKLYYKLTNHFLKSNLNTFWKDSLKNYENAIKSYDIQVYGNIESPQSDYEAYTYLQRRNFTNEMIRKFHIGVAKKVRINSTWFHNRIVIPIIDNKKIENYEGKAYFPEQKPKVLYPKSANTSTIFNIDNLKSNRTLIVTEGIFDLALIWRYFTNNVTATFGSSISKKQLKLLSQFEDIILFIDDDEAGWNVVNTFSNSECIDKDFRVAYVKDKDPGDASLEELDKALQKAKVFNEAQIKKSGLFTNLDIDKFF